MAFKRTKEKRSPLKTKPLRNPGESLDREIERLIDEELASYVLFAFSAILFAALEWLFWFLKLPPQPAVFTFVALGAVGYSAYKLLTVRRQVQALQQGLEGEKIVGQELEELRSI